MPKSLVVLTDGTGNEPRLRGDTNVLRLHDMLVHDEQQVVWYEPGVGTAGAPKALTPLGRSLTKAAGLLGGYGLKDNVTRAYRFLMRHWEPEDRIYLFGFSRGAYTARAIAGLLYQIGLLRPEVEHLVAYALPLYWWDEASEVSSDTWAEAEQFSEQFSRPAFPRRMDGSVHHVGVWDTVNATGVARGRLKLPWTTSMPMARTMSHAVAIDERRRTYQPSLLDQDCEGISSGAFREVWFAGVHSDIGGTFEPDHRLADITMGWLAARAIEHGLRVDPDRLASFQDRPASDADGEIHPIGALWAPIAWGFHRSIVPRGAVVHESVKVRMERSAGSASPYRPRLPEDVQWEPWPHRGASPERDPDEIVLPEGADRV